MELPKPPLKTATIEIAGVRVSYRSLSRAEALHLAEHGEGQEDAAEDYMLSCALDITSEEAHAWRNSVDLVTSQPLIVAIAQLSGLDADPKAFSGNS